MSDSRAMASTALDQSLVLNLELESSGKKVKIASGHIERFNLSLQPYGHTCAIQFSAFGDDVDLIFNAEEAAKATLTFKCVDPISYEEKGAPLLEIKGIVTEKCFKRLPQSNSKDPFRLYEITVHDNAKAVWEQHFPIRIYVKHSMQDIIKKHINADISISFDWDKLDIKPPITAFSLPHRDWLPEEQQVSFYSFVFWYLHQENGILAYDYKTHKYSMSGKKAKPAGKPFEIPERWAEPPVCFFPQTPRYNTKKYKHSFDAPNPDPKVNSQGFKEIWRDYISEENYRCFPEQAQEAVQSPLTPTKNVLEVEFNKVDGQFPFDKLVPGSGVTFKGLPGAETWSKETCYDGKTFVVRSLYVQSDKLSLTEELPKNVQAYRLQIKVVLEETDETFAVRPFYIPPTFPFAIQGIINCDLSKGEETFYKLDLPKEAPLGQYEVIIPLVEDKQPVVVPYTPDFMSGQFYYPFTKDQKVELSVYFHTAKILRLSDWQPLARLPKGIQGCQTVLASDGKDKYVIMRHEFVDNKNSVFTIKQSSSENQTQTIEIKEKFITVLVDEKDKKTLSICLNNDSGFTLSLEDKSASATQQIVFDGKTMTHTCKGSAGTSIIVQKPDEISFESKKFNIKTDEVSIEAKNSVTINAVNKYKLTTKIMDVPSKDVNLG